MKYDFKQKMSDEQIGDLVDILLNLANSIKSNGLKTNHIAERRPCFAHISRGNQELPFLPILLVSAHGVAPSLNDSHADYASSAIW